MFCKALMFWHLRAALLCEGKGFSITLGYFINRTAGARLPDLLSPPAVCVWACGDQMAFSQSSGKTARAWQIDWWFWFFLNQRLLAASVVCGPEASCLYAAGYWTQRVFYFLSVSQVKKKRPVRLTEPFILYYLAWLLTPGELCSQIDALLLWGCSWNIKLYWNIHMWVHLAESNWCATPQRPDGNVAGPRHPLADTLSSGRDSDCDLAEWTKSN